MSRMLTCLIKSEVASKQPELIRQASIDLQGCSLLCREVIEKLAKLALMFDQSVTGTKATTVRPMTKLSTNLQFNVGKVKSKKTAKKVQKLKEFAGNSYSYL